MKRCSECDTKIGSLYCFTDCDYGRAVVEKFDTKPYQVFLLYPVVEQLRELDYPVILGVLWDDDKLPGKQNDVTLAVIGQSKITILNKGDTTPRHPVQAWYDKDILCPDEVKEFFEKNFLQFLVNLNRSQYTNLTVEDVIDLLKIHIRKMIKEA